MKKIFLLIISLLSFATTSYCKDTIFIESIEEAQIIQQETNKPILVIFGAKYCHFCQQLKNDIMLDNEMSFVRKDFIICYIDIEEFPHLKDFYQVSNIPDSRILRNGKETDKFKGYTKRKYIRWLYNVK